MERTSPVTVLLIMLLVHAPADAQSFGKAAWIRQVWTTNSVGSMDIAVGSGEEVFLTGTLSHRMDVYFEASPSDADLMDTPLFFSGFLARYDGRDGSLVFVRSGRDRLVPVLPRSYRYGRSVAVVGDRLFHHESSGLQRDTVSDMVTVRDLEGSELKRIGPHERTSAYPTMVINGTEFDTRGNLYMVGTFGEPLHFSPDMVLTPSRVAIYSHPPNVIFLASYAPNGTLRWAQQIGNDSMNLVRGSYGLSGKAAFDVDSAGNTVLGIGFWHQPPDAFSTAVDGSALVWYSRDGKLLRVQTLEDLGISYEPSLTELRNNPVRAGESSISGASNYILYPIIVRHDNNGNLYVVWRKASTKDRSNSVTVGDTTFYPAENRYLYVLTKVDAQGALLWGRHLEHDHSMTPKGIETTEHGHAYLYGDFHGRYLVLGGVELTQEEPRLNGGFVAHFDGDGHVVRALHATGPGVQSVKTLALGPDGDVYVVGYKYRADTVVIGADTVLAKGANNVIVAKYAAAPRSSTH